MITRSHRSLLLTLVAACLMAAGCATSRPQTTDQDAGAPSDSPENDALSRIPDDPNALLPVDPAVREGVLENGLRYVIRENRHPEKRAELRLAVNAGSVLEEDDQRGLAHFLEHMAFNGTASYPKLALVDYLESIGMRMGPDLNAYTSFDETVFMLQVPTDSTAVMDKAVEILQEWAHRMLLDPEDVDKERGVVVEEWRLGRGARARMRDKQLPILLKDSRYAQRMPIGSRESLETFDIDALRRFYGEWYRPDLMTIVAVGDFDADEMESLIRRHGSKIPARENARERTLYEVPDHSETLFAIVSDPEADRTSLSLNYKHPVREDGTLTAYRESLVQALFDRMLSDRLSELTMLEDPPYLMGYSTQGRIVRTKEFYMLGAAVVETGIERGMDALVTEAARVARHGFTRAELDRTKQESLRWMEQIYRERNKTRSNLLAAEYVRHALMGEPIPGLEVEYHLYQRLIPGISLDDLNDLARDRIRQDNLVVEVTMPEKAGLAVPDPAALMAAIEMAKSRTIEPYVEDVSDEPLVTSMPEPGKIIVEEAVDAVGLTLWTLSNGVRVALKTTDFKNDQILMSAFSPGGHSLVSDEDYVAAATATALVEEGGLGDFSSIELNKKLSGQVAQVSPWIGELQEGLQGSASPDDAETLFQLIYLTFTAPRQDSVAYGAYRARLRGFLENRDVNPARAFQDTLRVTVTQHHFRTRPWSTDMLAEMDLGESLRIYKDRFADAGDFSFVFVGNVDLETFRPLVETYLGGLPSAGRTETWRDVGVRPPEDVVERVVRRGEEPKSQTSIIFTAPFEWTEKNRHHLFSLARVLDLKLRDVMREDLGGTYGVSVSASPSRDPIADCTVSFSFGSAPERAEEMSAVVMAQIDSIRTYGVDVTYVDKVRESMRSEHETRVMQNGYWLGAIEHCLEYGIDPREILNFEDRVDALTPEAIMESARMYILPDRYVRVVLLPEGDSE